MAKERDVDPLPAEFSSYEEAGEFWDHHDTMDYPDAFETDPVELKAEIRGRHFEIEVEEDLFGALRERARRSGTTVKGLVGELLRRQLTATS
jgi:CopG antitoxin of type II toxin-antitoxin system